MAGVLRVGGAPVERAMVAAMLGALAHRGPDGRGIWTQGSLGLGHVLLQSTPESRHERQPLVRGELTLVADCRIDNRTELCSELGVARPHDTITDPELLLSAYERWGEGCVYHLLGDFAFVVWDGRSRTLFCARDHFGVKPLYYYRDHRTFAFASEIKGLLVLPEVPREVDEAMIADHLMASFDDAEITYWKGIKRLPAAHTMTVSGAEQTDRGGSARAPRRYWSLGPYREIRLASDAEYADTLRTLFLQAVNRRLRSSHPIGAALSGGLDSTAVACAAERRMRYAPTETRDHPEGTRPGPIHTFSVVFDCLPEVDERAWIQPALNGGDFIPHFIVGDALDPLRMLDGMLQSQDGIFYAPNLYLHWAMYEEAQWNGVRIFLDGLDGDSTLSHGTAYPRELLLRGRWRAALRETRAAARRHDRSTWCLARRLSVLPLPPALLARARSTIRRVRRKVERPSPDPWNRFGILNPAFDRRIGARDRYLSLSGHHLQPVRREREAHYRQIAWPLQTFMLESADRAAAAHGIEPRYPFYDVPLVEFCLAVPGGQKLRDGWTRWVMRRAMEGILPPEVQWRAGKSNLGPVLMRALHQFDRSAVDDLLSQPDTIASYVDMSALRECWARFIANPSPGDVMSIWLPLVLDRGLRWSGMSAWTRCAVTTSTETGADSVLVDSGS